MSTQFEDDLDKLPAEEIRRQQREKIDTWDVDTVAKILDDLGESYPYEIIFQPIETLRLAVSRSEFGATCLRDGFVPYHPFFAARLRPPLQNPLLYSRTYPACHHILCLLYDPFRSDKQTFPPAWASHYALWNDTSDLCHRCREEQAAGLPQA
jgi:hypothetical protein